MVAGMLWAAGGRFQSAVEALALAASLFDTPDTAISQYYSKDGVLLRHVQAVADAGTWDEALTLVERGVAQTTDARAVWRVVRARVLRQRGQLSAAREDLEAVLADPAKLPPAEARQARLSLIATLLVLNRLADAESQLADIERSAPEHDRATSDIVRLLREVIAARRVDTAEMLSLPAVPEVALERCCDPTRNTPPSIERGASSSERFASRFGVAANHVLLALAERKPAEALERATELRDLAATTDSTWLHGRARYYVALAHFHNDEHEQAASLLESAVAAARQQGSVFEAWQAANLSSWCLAKLGDQTGYEARVADAHDLLEEVAASLTPVDRAWFQMNKASARDEYLVAHMRQAMRVPPSLAPFGWLRRWLDRRTQRQAASRVHGPLDLLSGWGADDRMGRRDDEGAARAPATATTGGQIEAWVAAQLKARASSRAHASNTPSGIALSKRLPSDTAVLHFYVAPMSVYALLVQRGDVHLFASPVTRLGLDERLRDWWRALNDCGTARPYGDDEDSEATQAAVESARKHFHATGSRVSDALCIPRVLEVLPPRVTVLRVIPHDVLANVPWPALPFGEQRLCERVSTSIHPSLGWVTPRPDTKLDLRNEEILAVSISKFSRQGRRDLPHASRECEALQRRFARVSWLRDDEATRSSVTAAVRDVAWAHFATHAIFDCDAPMKSRLVLGGDEADDLTAEALSAVDLRRLRGAVLGACDSGVQATLPGGETAGLPMSLLYAGVGSVIAPVWPVNDRMNPEFIADLYDELTKQSPERALSKAQASWAKSPDPRRSSPERWAIYLHFGDGGKR